MIFFFLHDLYDSDVELICEMVDVDLEWNYFKTTCLDWNSKHLLEDLESMVKVIHGLMKLSQTLLEKEIQ